MSVCNIFNQLNSSGGTFLTFSQYAEDLTRELSDPQGYHISPSKFIALNINYNTYDNTTLPQMLQNEYENACAFFKDATFKDVTGDKEEKYIEWSPNHARSILIDTLVKQLIDSNDFKERELNELVYIGDINMVSSNNIDGLSYNELFCYIPNDVKRVNYKITKIDNGKHVPYNETYIKGYNTSDSLALDGQISYSKKYTYDASYSIEENTNVQTSENMFMFNTIIVLYNIYSINADGNMSELYKNIPMGIYFTGPIENYVMTNAVTKYTSSEETFGSGTSYGLKICTRFTASPVGSKVVGVNVSTENTSTALVLSEMSKTLNNINKMIANNVANMELLKTSLAVFKNDRTNVPYIKTINGYDYWFVNGRNMGVITGYTNYPNEEVDSGIDDFDKTLI